MNSNPKTCFVLLPAAAGIALAGCGSAESEYKPTPSKPVEVVEVQPGEERSLFPLKEGNQWTYTGQTASRVQGRPSTTDFEMVFKVVKVVPRGNGSLADIEVSTNLPNSKVDYQRWEVNDKGIYQVTLGNPPVAFSPAQPIVLFPLTADRTFVWKGRGMTPAGQPGTSTLDGTILAPQVVDTANERVSAYGVESKGTFQAGDAKGQVESISYWTPGVGLVRYQQRIAVGQNAAVQTLRLKTKTLR